MRKLVKSHKIYDSEWVLLTINAFNLNFGSIMLFQTFLLHRLGTCSHSIFSLNNINEIIAAVLNNVKTVYFSVNTLIVSTV